MFIHAIVALLLTIIAAGSAEVISTFKTKNSQDVINKYADAIVTRLKTHLIERGVEPVKVAGVGPLGEGEFTGLLAIRRLRDASLNRRNHTVTLHTVLDDDSHLNFPCSLVVFGRNVCNGRTSFSLGGLTLGLEFRTRGTADGLPQLEVCDVSDLGRMRMKFGQDDQTVVFAPLLAWMGKWFSTLLKSRVAKNLEDVLCNTLASNM